MRVAMTPSSIILTAVSDPQYQHDVLSARSWLIKYCYVSQTCQRHLMDINAGSDKHIAVYPRFNVCGEAGLGLLLQGSIISSGRFQI